MHTLRVRALRLVVAALTLTGWPGIVAAQTSLTKWYLAEGATGTFFEEEILIGNPNTSAAEISITYLRPAGAAPITQTFTMPATSRKTVRVNDVPGLASAPAVSAVVECTNGLDIVVERSMYWSTPARRGGHNSPGVFAPATKWLLAEGSTGFFDTFVLVANPDTTHDAEVEVSFLLPDGTMVKAQRPVEANSRLNVWVNQEVPELASKAFSTVVESLNGVPVFVERAMYFGGSAWEGGHESTGLTEASKSWFFAEGFTGGTPALAFDTFLLLGNPGTQEANVTVTFLLEGVAPIVRTRKMPPTSRDNVWVNVEPGLENAAFSMQVESDQPIIAERAEYWGPTDAWLEAHNTPGVTASALKWAFAEGGEDALNLPAAGQTMSLNYDSYFLVANPSSSVLKLRATFMREDGTGIVETYDVPAQSRFTIPTSLYPELSNQRFAAFLESTNDVKFAAERAMYWGAGWYGGHASTGTPWTGTIGTPATPPAPRITKVDPATGLSTGGTAFVIEGTNFRQGSTVTFGGVAATGVRVLASTQIVGITPAHALGTVDVLVSAGTTTASLAGGFTYVAPPPAPVVTSVAPASVPTTGGTTLTVNGTGFTISVARPGGGSDTVTLVTDVSVGGVSRPFSMTSPSSLTVLAPPHKAGAVDVKVTSPYGVGTGSFTYVKATATDNILAFGDSITEGVIATGCTWVITLTSQSVWCDVRYDGGYPSRLRGMLQTEYPNQTITVNNGGVGGELTGTGKGRLPSTLRASNDLVVIMEGVNDLNAGVLYGTIVGNLRAMVQTAKAAGKKVMLGTVLPAVTVTIDDLPYTKSDNAAINELNRRLRIVAGEEDVILADFHASFLKPGINTASLLSEDGLHPSPAGYDRMADLVRNLIVQNYETVPPIVP